MNEESKLPINCLVFLGGKPNDDGLDPPYYWLQSANKAWCLRAPFSSLELELALFHLPASVRRRFEALDPAMSRGQNLWALRLGMTEMDEAELDREWLSAPLQPVVFREPVNDGDDNVIGLDVPEIIH